MILFLAVLAGTGCVLALFIFNPSFGRLPRGGRLLRIRQQPQYKAGALQNLLTTPMQPEGVSMWTILRAFFGKHPRRRPAQPIPLQRSDYTGVSGTSVTWYGHSSYLLQVDGRRILVDPVFSNRPSPYSFIGTSRFAGTELSLADLPHPDVVVITHDHYDHLDYPVIRALAKRQPLFVCSLGVGEHLIRWGIDAENIRELGWNENEQIWNLKFTAVPARHFTGRFLKRNQTLWSAFVLETATEKLFLGGDSGYGPHFNEIGAEHGPFDLAILECGQYNAYWPFIHMFPEETVTAAADLRAARLMPVHWGKYTLAMHPWDEPIIRAAKQARLSGMPLLTPAPGKTVSIKENATSPWWASLQ